MAAGKVNCWPMKKKESVSDMVWTAREAPMGYWCSVMYKNGMFITLARSTASTISDAVNFVTTSPDGINWTARNNTRNLNNQDFVYGNGIFVQVGIDVVMTSPDGINWTARSCPSAMWSAVTYDNGMFVAVGTLFSSLNGAAMTSPNGINWTLRAMPNYAWSSVTYGNGVFVAVGRTAYNDPINFVTTSPDGINWTARSCPIGEWYAVTYGNGMFVAVGDGVVMTSPDGINWTARNPALGQTFFSVTCGNNLFVAVSGHGGTMTSPDGINWTARSCPIGEWLDVAYGNGVFVAVGKHTIMTSGHIPPPSLQSITLTPPTKLSYYQDDIVNYDGLTVTAHYSDGTSNIITDYNVSPAAGSTLDTLGDNVITVTYKGKTATFTVNVREVPVITSITVTPPTKLNYVIGDAIDYDGMIVTATYSDGTNDVVSGYDISPAAGTVLDTLGDIDVLVTYRGFSGGFSVSVSEVPVEFEFTYTGDHSEVEEVTYSDGAYKQVKLLTKGTFTPLVNWNVDIFLVGGGGQGGGAQGISDAGGGGGGGYTQTFRDVILNAQEQYPVIIGAGGSGTPINLAGNTGGNTQFGNDYIANGGKGGKGSNINNKTRHGGDGGSGGGAGGWSTLGGTGGSNGSNGVTSSDGGNGGSGQGTTTRAFEDTNGELYAGGGGGYTYNGAGGAGGAGGGGQGGDGGDGQGGASSQAGTPNTGGGSGGEGRGIAASGGSGICIVRWQ